ncbi:DUF305 domain-containing protein [Streptomyces formicae]|uniref:DUF305 domain-containing protein n=1 Tax=Streptomyces formicae TaxID=1616117 RepID=A0ABY3WQX4_9ACTN|nr:DUF305 domain-containing protein [Streptomyces formicae]UNM13869.1 DUF305 domain-containing protein [Streptomyces formicae]
MTFFQRALTRPVRRGAAVAGAVAAGALLLTACGDEGVKSPAASPEAGASAAPGGFNDADVAFAQGMIPHHQQALEMAGLADGRASDQEIKTLAGRIKKAQDPEITTMRSWLTSWGRPESPTTDHGAGHGNGHGDMPGTASGMMSDQDMDALMSAKGADFDRKFARMMIDHHNGAIAMAKAEQQNGRNVAAKKLAGDVIESQAAEVDRMQDILDRF